MHRGSQYITVLGGPHPGIYDARPPIGYGGYTSPLPVIIHYTDHTVATSVYMLQPFFHRFAGDACEPNDLIIKEMVHSLLLWKEARKVIPDTREFENVYVVVRGRKTGIFFSWKQCYVQVHGFSDVRFMAYKNLPEAIAHFLHKEPATYESLNDPTSWLGTFENYLMDILNQSIRADENGDDDEDAVNGTTGRSEHVIEGLNDLMQTVHIDNTLLSASELSGKGPRMTNSCSSKTHVHEVSSKIVGTYSEMPSHAACIPSNVRSHAVKMDAGPSQVQESPAPLIHIINAKPTTALYTVEQCSTPLTLTPYIRSPSPSPFDSRDHNQQRSCCTGVINLSFNDDINEKFLVPSLGTYADYYISSHSYTYRARVEVVAAFANSRNREEFVARLHGVDVPAKHLEYIYFLCKNRI
ncbi:uncharacterized protein LAESUDRAFT_754607 [Laetiporus sulphureus 93-53]|uniref:Ribonuclease H1 N-terminal domain-containing protein n=1 Tax=Laetiporus sulphureus 93-53 TaxID=1314785 RepID=A0A165HRS7_9APHY|nr:uncharacterized protein LAESUDRAFT_754607 [Laetiporus sulphureus 93-53]KZT12097.1 hypothetical protein LAESUDRAFT_754607 [Laetiporus sulphureus 93-53]